MPRPNDDDVIDIDIDLDYLRVAAQASGHLRITRVATCWLVAADDNGDVCQAKCKFL
jgi:hypothetical protein